MSLKITNESAIQTALAFGDWKARLHGDADADADEDEFEEEETDLPEISACETSVSEKKYWRVVHNDRTFTITHGSKYRMMLVIGDNGRARSIDGGLSEALEFIRAQLHFEDFYD
jgi:hypothetical protein